MELLTTIVQIVIAAGIFNVWLLRSGRPSPFRPEGASDMSQEFRRYGFPDWARKLAGAAKVTMAALLLVGIWVPAIAFFASVVLGALMAVAVGAHLWVRDPFYKALPALGLLGLCVFVAAAHLG